MAIDSTLTFGSAIFQSAISPFVSLSVALRLASFIHQMLPYSVLLDLQHCRACKDVSHVWSTDYAREVEANSTFARTTSRKSRCNGSGRAFGKWCEDIICIAHIASMKLFADPFSLFTVPVRHALSPSLQSPCNYSLQGLVACPDGIQRKHQNLCAVPPVVLHIDPVLMCSATRSGCTSITIICRRVISHL